MIAMLRGVVSAKFESSFILDVAGVGYEVIPTASGLELIEVGAEQTVYIAEAIKDDSYTLYGFAESMERMMYYQLTSVSGVGPKAAMAILNKHNVNEIEGAILKGDITLFSNVSGIGRKTAQRLILELRGKLVAAPEKSEVSSEPAYQALISLGYTPTQARTATKDLPPDANLDTKVKLALKELAK